MFRTPLAGSCRPLRALVALLLGAMVALTSSPAVPADPPPSEPAAGRSTPAAEPAPPSEPAAGRAAPEFAAADLRGDTLTLRDLRGRFVLLNFWGPQCPPCVAESPHLQRLHKKYEKRGLSLVGVTQMNPKREVIETFLRKKRVTYRIVLDPGEVIGAEYGVRAHPTSVLVDPDGNVRWVRAGYLAGDEKEMEAAIVAALQSPTRPQP
jgi:peroxiredoxin